MAKKQTYGNDSITSLKGADRVRLRPAVIFGSDGIDGCQHSIFEILSNSIDEAREGYGKEITVTRYRDHSIEVEDFGRGIPVDYNEQGAALQLGAGVLRAVRRRQIQQRRRARTMSTPWASTAWALCATQYASEYMDVDDPPGRLRATRLHFEQGENVGGLQKEPYSPAKRPAPRIRWQPDLEVFTDIDMPAGVLPGYAQSARRWSTPGVTFRLAQRDGRRQVRDHGVPAMKTASSTMCRSWRARTR